MRAPAAAALLCASLLCGGCFTIERAPLLSSGRDHMLAANYGWYLFHFIPLACGNASNGAWTPWALFRDDVTLDKIQARFMERAGAEAESVSGLAYTTRESVMLQIPGLQIPLPVPYLLTYREIQLSGTLDREKEAGR